MQRKLQITSNCSTKSIQKCCVLIGQGNLLVECGNAILAIGWVIIEVISDDESTLRWAERKGINTRSTAELEHIEASDFVLFSIVNTKKINTEFIQNKKISVAINFHDSFLPHYRGLNSTTWALLNGERQHGCTWHLIDESIDTGKILIQDKVTIEPNETAFTLNMKCFRKGFDLFKELISDFNKIIDSAKEQARITTQYYGREAIPDQYGILSGDADQDIKLLHALDFGEDQINEVATGKVFLNEEFYIVRNYDDLKLKTSELKNIYGETVCIDHNVSPVSIALDPCIEKQIAHFKKHEKFAIKTIKNIFNKSDAKIFDREKFFGEPYFVSIKVGSNVGRTDCLISTIIALANFMLNDAAIITIYPGASLGHQLLDKLFEQKVFYKIGTTKLLKITVNNLYDEVRNSLKFPITIAKDALYRYKLMEFLTDIAICLGENPGGLPYSHTMIITISNNSIALNYKGDHQVAKYLLEVINHILQQVTMMNRCGSLQSIQFMPKNKLTDIISVNKTETHF